MTYNEIFQMDGKWTSYQMDEKKSSLQKDARMLKVNKEMLNANWSNL
jgi:hypothetical protein